MTYKYDVIYSKNKNFFGSKSKIVDLLLKHIKKRGKLLDLGVGQGRIAIPLAKEGFEVEGVDLSEVGLNQFREFAKSEKLKVNMVHSDFENYIFKQSFNLIISNVSLQFLGDINKIEKIISKIKKTY